MQAPESNLEALANRVARLEAQNRRLKKAGIAVALLASTVVVMGQAPTSKVIEANEFHVKDANGRVRAKLLMSEGSGPRLDLFDEDEKPMASLSAIARIGALSLGSTLGSSGSVILEPNIGLLLTGDAGAISATTIKALGGPDIRLSDKEGFETVIGKVDLVKTHTGREESTPAASVVLFGNDKKVLWSAP
jgi:hypothetical protein